MTRIVDDFKEASNEIQCLSRDIHQFFSIVRPLDIALREQIVKDVVESDEGNSRYLQQSGRSASQLSHHFDRVNGQRDAAQPARR